MQYVNVFAFMWWLNAQLMYQKELGFLQHSEPMFESQPPKDICTFSVWHISIRSSQVEWTYEEKQMQNVTTMKPKKTTFDIE